MASFFMHPIVRFAPSPTGRLHIGNIRTAVLNWLYALKCGGTFILRLDDTDRERSTAAFADGIRADLRWLGLGWSREERQSDRIALYDAAAARLRATGRLYPCFETEDELDRRRKRQMAMGRPPIYDRAALKLDAAERARLQAAAHEAGGRRPHWRFRLANTEGESLAPLPTIVSWNDLIRGDQTVDAGSLSDPVMIRADGSYLYTFTSVVDDIDMGITHVIRGEDHVTNTGVQIEIFEALGAQVPAFGHFPLLVGADGQGLSKRLGALSIEQMREDGIEPAAITSLLARLGTADPVTPESDLAALAAAFDFARIGRAPARFDETELLQLNAKILHETPFAALAGRLAALGVSEPVWEAVKGNVERVADAARWKQVIEGPIDPVIEDASFAAKAAALVPDGPLTEQSWGSFVEAVKKETGAKGRALFHPLRAALTGAEKGPEMAALFPLIGAERARARLLGARA